MKKGVFYPVGVINDGEKMVRRVLSKEGIISDCGELILHNEPSITRFRYGVWQISHIKTGYRCLGELKHIPSKKRGLEMLQKLSKDGLGLWSQIGENPVIPEPLKGQLKAIVINAISSEAAK